ncbi:MAG: TonB-dependent siderophore receptor [Betaproteobacteria bacterium]
MVSNKPALTGVVALLATCFAASLPAQAAAADPAKGAEQNEIDDAREKELKQVNVTGDRERDKTYQPGLTNIGKTRQLPRDIPQSVTVVPESLMHDRSVDTFREALRTVPSITFNAGEGGRIGDNITLRGFSVVGDLYMDGIRDIAQYNRETFNAEQIEVLRGSSSMLYGRGSTGGIINQVSKAPTVVERTVLGLTLGQYHYARATADTNQVIGENMAIRVNAMRTGAESFRDDVSTDRTGFAPSLRWGIGTANEFQVSHYHLQYDDIPDYGVPYFNGKPLDVPLNRFYGLADANYQRDKADISTLTYTHVFDAQSSLRSVIRAAEYHRDLWAVAPRLAGTPTAITDATVINRQRQARGGDESALTSQTDYNGKFSAWGVKHQVLLGMEWVREDAERWSYAQAAGVTNPTTTVGNPDSRPTLASNYFSSVTRTGHVSYTADTAGLYGQETLELNPQWKLVLGARFDNFTADYQRTAPAGPLNRTDRVWSTRTGVLFQPDDFATYYAAFGTSFNPSGELYAMDDRGANTPPEKNRNIEIGAKWELFDGNLSLRTALFRSEKTNERNTDLAVTVAENLLSGKRHTNGVEIEAAGLITPNWQVFAGAARMSARIDNATGQQANTLGKVPINTPAYTVSLWSVYKVTENWRVGAGLEAVGKRFGNATDTAEAPAYTRSDGMISYERNAFAVKLNVLNAFNRKIYEGVYQGHVVPGTARTTQVTFEYKFF